MKKVLRSPLLLLISWVALNSCCGIPVPVIDTEWRDQLDGYSWYTLNGTVWIAGGYHSRALFYREDWDLFEGITRDYSYQYIPSRRVYTATDSLFLFDLQSTWPDESLDINGGLLTLVKGKVSDETVLREPRYYAELNGSVYCVAGETDGYPMESTAFGDVWKTSDGLRWERILEKGPWTAGGETLRMHKLFVLDDDRGRRIWLSGGYNDRDHLKGVWSTDDGINWTKEGEFPEFGDFNGMYSFKQKVYLRGTLDSGETVTLVRGSDGGFRPAEGPWDKAYNGELTFFVWQDRLWAATNSGLLVSEDGEHWTEMFNSPDFGSEVAVIGDRLCRTDIFLLNEQLSFSDDGFVWSWPDSDKTYDYHPSADVPYDTASYETPAVLELDGVLWLLTGHPDGIWKSTDGREWTRVSLPPESRFVPRVRFASVVFNGRLWIIGGVHKKPVFYQEDEPFGDIYLVLNDVWSSADGINWRQETDPPWYRRYKAVAVVRGGELYLVGGAAYGRDYREIWKTGDGRSWEKVCHYPDLYEGEEIRPDFQNTLMFRDSLCLFDCYVGDALLSLDMAGHWTCRGFSDSGYLHPDLDNIAVMINRSGREIIFAWNDGTLEVSDDIVHWKEIARELDPPEFDYTLWPDPVLVRFGGELFLVGLQGDTVTSARIIPGK